MIGFSAYKLDHYVNLDFDYEHPELSTTAGIAPKELARIEMSETISGYRIYVAQNVATDCRTLISDGSLHSWMSGRNTAA